MLFPHLMTLIVFVATTSTSITFALPLVSSTSTTTTASSSSTSPSRSNSIPSQSSVTPVPTLPPPSTEKRSSSSFLSSTKRQHLRNRRGAITEGPPTPSRAHLALLAQERRRIETRGFVGIEKRRSSSKSDEEEEGEDEWESSGKGDWIDSSEVNDGKKGSSSSKWRDEEDEDEEDDEEVGDEEDGKTSYASLSDARSTPTSTSSSTDKTSSSTSTGKSSSSSWTSTSTSSSSTSTSTGKSYASKGSSSEDCTILSALYTSLGGASPGWINVEGWSTANGDCCTYYGVSCDVEGRVTALDLAGNGLSGPLDNRVFSLGALNRLNLSMNALTGPLPDSFSSTPLLSTIYLDSNLFTGPLPPSFLASSSLQYLHLANNSLTGSLIFPSATNLSVIDVPRNLFDGQFEITAQSGAITRINLDYNRIVSTVPDLSTMPGLTSFSIKGNSFTGQVSSISNLANLVKLDVSSNALTGPYPDPTGLTHLTTFSIASNSFSGPFPSTPAPPSLLSSTQSGGCKIDAALPSSACPSDQVLSNPTSLAAYCQVVCKGGGVAKTAVGVNNGSPVPTGGVVSSSTEQDLYGGGGGRPLGQIPAAGNAFGGGRDLVGGSIRQGTDSSTVVLVVSSLFVTIFTLL